LTAKTVLHSLSLVLMLLFALSGIIGFIVVKDAIDFRKNLAVQDNIIVLADGNEALAGYILGDPPSLLTGEQAGDAEAVVAGRRTEGDYYKAFVIDIKILDEIPGGEVIISDDFEIPAEDAKEALRSDDPQAVLKLPSSQVLSAASGEELKVVLFSLIFSNHLAQDPLFLFEQYKEGNVRVEPETSLFKFMKYAPIGLIKAVAGSAFELAGKKSQEFEEEEVGAEE